MRQATLLSAVTQDAPVPKEQYHPTHQGHGGKGPGANSPTFNRMYTGNGGARIPSEHLLKASLLMELFSVSSERQFCERLWSEMIFKWLLDLNIMDHSFAQSVLSKNRQRLLVVDAARESLLQIVSSPIHQETAHCEGLERFFARLPTLWQQGKPNLFTMCGFARPAVAHTQGPLRTRLVRRVVVAR